MLRAHQRDLGARLHHHEFLDDVGWQRERHASLNDATGLHISEERWLRDRRHPNHYIDFMYQGGGDDRHFAEGNTDATYARFLADGDRAFSISHLDTMLHIHNLWDDHFDFDKGLYWIEPLLDATEYKDVPYEGHRVTIFFDAEGRQYHRGRGLFVIVDWQPSGHAETLSQIPAPLAMKAPEPVARPIDLAVQLVRTGLPRMGSRGWNGQPQPPPMCG